jgi:hypothetical protein
MIINEHEILKRNYQKFSTNRFVVDSPRFWRKEYHPHFNDIFELAEFKQVLTVANTHQSFPLDTGFCTFLAEKLYNWFSGYRFIAIPKKDPSSPEMFLSDLFFVMLDILPQITFTDYKLQQDDFNLVTHKAETGKNDTSKVATGEIDNQKSKHETGINILTKGELKQISTANTENIDDETEQNNQSAQDVFLSAQNQGVTPTTENKRHGGVDGLILNPNEGFTTNTQNTNFGESLRSKSNATSQSQQSEQMLLQDNDATTIHETLTDMTGTQEQENTTAKNDNYIETLDFNRGARLQDFYNLNSARHWHEILHRLTTWILHVNIATSEINYNECETY